MEMKCTFQSTRAPFQCAWWFPNSIYWTLKEPIVLKIPNSLASLRSIRHLELKSVGSLYNVFEIHRKEVNSSLLEVKAMNKDTEADSDSDRKIKEEERRRKIGLANRGKVPWNKGRKHSEDTRRRIKQRTIEALTNPKVKSSSEEDVRSSTTTQVDFNETKEKIRASVKQVWAERSRSKRLKEKFMSSWSENIAEAARKGGSGEAELDWDSYERIKQDFSSEQLQLAEEKARAKEQTKMIAKEAAKARTEKMRRAAEKKKEREEKDRREGKIRKPKQERENPTIASRSKLKKRLTKIHKKKTSLGKIAIGTDRVVSVAAKLEKLDLDLIRKERTRGDISLADQIQAAKNQRGSDVLSRFGLFAMKSMDFD
ncbi:hypothetical protein AXX17_AT1G47560 [Arabidopsis thaliana]|uniref:Nuclease associated modular domain-containing protein n=1 Tax=Arabidopsis thaliana TaxID=3702 RepID=A0A178W740_ARATH|nr:hypothetical protein AXX17_AT1G47560 [Arabidopsis thaliana]